MSHPTATTITRIYRPNGTVEVYAEGCDLVIDYDGIGERYAREEALLLVEAITARLAEVTEGQ